MLPLILQVLDHPAIPVVTFLLGVLLGHHTALWRDRRKERNEAIEPVRAFLLAERHKPSRVLTRPTLQQFDLVYDRIGRRAAGRLRGAWEQYEATCKGQLMEPDAAGQRHYRDLDAIRKAADACLSHLRRR
jgi:hypothetical protein